MPACLVLQHLLLLKHFPVLKIHKRKCCILGMCQLKFIQWACILIVNKYTHTYMCMYVHTLYIHICTYIIHTCIHTYIHMYIHTYIHTYICTNIHTYIHTYIYTHTYMYTCIHTHTHTYIHTYIHKCTQTFKQSSFAVSVQLFSLVQFVHVYSGDWETILLLLHSCAWELTCLTNYWPQYSGLNVRWIQITSLLNLCILYYMKLLNFIKRVLKILMRFKDFIC